EGQDMFFEVAEAVGRGAEAGPGFAEHGVAAPAEVTEEDTAVGVTADQGRLPEAVALFPLDERVADQHNAVAVAQGEVTRGPGRAGREDQEPREGCKETKVFHGVLPTVFPQMIPDHRRSSMCGCSLGSCRCRVNASRRRAFRRLSTKAASASRKPTP